MNLTTATPSQLPPAADTPANPSDRVSDLIQKLVAAATAEVESAAQRTRAQAEVEMIALRRTIDSLRHEVQAERDRLKAVTEQLAKAQTAAAQLNEELDAEKTEKARFAATLETVRLVVSGIDGELHPTDPAPSRVHVADADDELTREDEDSDQEVVLDEVDVDGDSTDRTESGRHLVQLLSQIEEIYRSDLKLAEGTSDVVARLTANLEYARDAYARRRGGDEDGTQFDRQLAMLLESRADTPFARDLAMAIRYSSRDRGNATELEQQAS